MTVVELFIRPLAHAVGCTQSLVKKRYPGCVSKFDVPHRLLFSILVDDTQSAMPARESPNSGTHKHRFWHALTQVIAFLKPVVSRGVSFNNGFCFTKTGICV